MPGKDVTGILIISAQTHTRILMISEMEYDEKLLYQRQQLGTKKRRGFEDSIQR